MKNMKDMKTTYLIQNSRQEWSHKVFFAAASWIKLLYEAKIAVLADIHFGSLPPGEGQHIRFSYATSNENIMEGLRRLKDFVRKYRK